MCARVGTASCPMCHRTMRDRFIGYRSIGASCSWCAATLPDAVVPLRWTVRQLRYRTICVTVGFLTGEVPRIGFTLVRGYVWVFNGAQPLNGLFHIGPINAAICQDSSCCRRGCTHRTDMRRHKLGSLPCDVAGDGCCGDRTSAAGIGRQRRRCSCDAPAGRHS